MQFSVHTQDQCTSCKDRHKARARCEDQAHREAEDQARREAEDQVSRTNEIIVHVRRAAEAREAEDQARREAETLARQIPEDDIAQQCWMAERLNPVTLGGHTWYIDYKRDKDHQLGICSDAEGIFFYLSDGEQSWNGPTAEDIWKFLADDLDGHLRMEHPLAGIFEKIIGELVFRSFLDDAPLWFHKDTIVFLRDLGNKGFRITPTSPVVCMCIIPGTFDLWIQTRSGGQPLVRVVV